MIGRTRQLFPEGLFLLFLFFTIEFCICYFIKRDKINIIKIIVFTIFGLLSSFGIHVFSLSSFGAGRILVAMGMTIGYLFMMIYILTDIFNEKKLISYATLVILFIYIIVTVCNFYILTRDHLIVNDLDKNRVQEIYKYINEYENENDIEVKYIAMIYVGFNEKAYYKRINGINGFGLYTEWAFDGLINFYTEKNLEKIDLTFNLYKKYMIQAEEDYKALCIDNVLVCPVYIV